MKTWFKKNYKYFVYALVAIAFIVLIFSVTGKKSTEEKAENIPAVVVQKPIRMDLKESVNISGYVEAKAMIPVVPFVSGTIMEYPVKAGDYVEKNAVLAKIDDAPFKQQMLQAQASYFAAKSTFDRVKSLYQAGATTQQNYDNARAQYDAATAQYDLAKLQMDYTVVKAPVAGTVLMADQAVGSIGSTGTPVAVLADLTDQVVRLKVPEKYFDLFTLEKENLSVLVTRPAEKNMYEDAITTATIENIAPYVSPQSKNFEVVCHLDKPGERFRPGMYVRVQIAYKTHKQVLTMPMKTKKLDGSFYIYDVESQTVKYMDPVESVSDGENFIVPPEYENVWFVVDGQNFVFDGQKVRLYEDVLSEYGY